jgi:hypothetical protein
MAAFLQNTSAGVMNSVMEKLGALMGEQYEKHKAVPRDVVAFLEDEPRQHERSCMLSSIRKLTNMEELDHQTIEDPIDDFRQQAYCFAGPNKQHMVLCIRVVVSSIISCDMAALENVKIGSSLTGPKRGIGAPKYALQCYCY